jgi:hypothetical protein
MTGECMRTSHPFWEVEYPVDPEKIVVWIPHMQGKIWFLVSPVNLQFETLKPSHTFTRA